MKAKELSLLRKFVEKREFIKGNDGRVYGRFAGEAIPVKSERFIRKLARLVYEEHNIFPSESVIKQVILPLSEGNIPRRVIPIRFAWDAGGNIWVDRGEEEISFVKITPAGASLYDEFCDIVFMRPPSMRNYPRPRFPKSDEECAAVFEEYRKFLGVGNGQFAAITTWQLCAMRPMQYFHARDEVAEYPILKVVGSEGAGKTTTADFISRAVDPSAAQHTGLPKNEESINVSGENQRVLAWDNTTHINSALQDALARRSTGDATGCRTLYSDRDYTLFVGSNPIIVTSIADAITQPDVLSRTLVLALTNDRTLKTRGELNEVWNNLSGRYFGALCYALGRILREIKNTAVPKGIRMADSAQWALAAVSATGVKEECILEAFAYAANEATALVFEDPLPAAIIRYMQREVKENGGSQRQSVGAWLTCFTRTYTEMNGTQILPRGWPRSAQALSWGVSRYGKALTAAEIQVVRTRVNGRSLIEFSFADPPANV